ncbi:DUF3015 domain-containing protein [Gammaproteobacteria bacterium]|nr:DUF3015 domain-containing protein [Gammaproteobacteria bacterium]
MKLKLLTAVVLSAGLSVTAAPSFAQGAGSGPNPFVDCGIGAALFPNTHWAAVISNVIWDVGTTAVTSATMSPETCSGSSVQTAQFIFDTYNNLVEETAKGSGEHLATLFNIQGCNDEVRSDLLAQIRMDMSGVVSTSGYDSKTYLEKSSDYYDVVVSATSSSCSA